MEQIITFVLGIISGSLVIMLISSIIGILKMKKHLDLLDENNKDLSKQIENLQKDISQIYTHIDEKVVNIENGEKDIYRYVDSRFDKHIEKLSKLISDQNSSIYQKIEELENKEIKQINS